MDVYATNEKGAAVRDLTAADFEVFEDGVPQKIETFEHVEVQGRVTQESRREPQTVAESRSMAEDPRARVFVIFLDTYHTSFAASRRMRRPLLEFLNRVIGPDDLFAVMTPDMSAREIALTRRTTGLESTLSRHWPWGTRDDFADPDPTERMYEQCWPPHAPPKQCRVMGRDVVDPAWAAGIAGEMVYRRREKLSLDALTDLAVYLHGVREERKAVVTITDGWTLYRPNPRLARVGPCDRPALPRIGVGPDGRVTADETRDQGYLPQAECEKDRQMLASLDNWRTFRELLDRANRANVSFYPVDSRGLAVWDTPIEHLSRYGDVPASEDVDRLRDRSGSLRTLAEATDGLAVLGTNDLERGMRRIIDDVTSYYLLGYYSANTKLDGKFRSITVKVRRPDVDVRARRGYAPPTAEEVAQAIQPAPVVTAATAALQSALSALASIRADRRLSTHLSWMASPTAGRVWVTGELDPRTARSAEWAAGGVADVLVTAGDNADTLASARQPIAPGARVVSVELTDVPLAPGEYTLQLRLSPKATGAALHETARIEVPDSDSGLGSARLYRRGPTTGGEYVPTATAAFLRTERLRVDVPLPSPVDAVGAELLDRNGSPMSVPVVAGIAAGEGGALAWARAEVVLAPLAPGDYVVRTRVERQSRRQEVLAAFRVVP